MDFEIDQIFIGEYPPEAAEFCNNSGNCYIEEIEPDGEHRRFQIVAIPEPTLEELKEAKLSELNSKFDIASSEASVMSSLGFEINADEVANRNIEGLTLVMSDSDTTLFCDYNNEFHSVSKADLETMRKEIVVNSQKLYQVKWEYRQQIESASTKEALEQIEINFSKE